jgi:hypothetical protein
MNPPRWAEAFLRATLKPRDRETVSGDLFEEFREWAVPTLGPARARIWYVRQVASLTDLPSLGRISSPFDWVAVMIAVQFVFLFVVPRALGLRLELSLFAPFAVALGVVGALSIQSREQVWMILRQSAVWGTIFAAAMLSKMTFGAIPFPMLGLLVATTFLAPAFIAAWKTTFVWVGILAVLGASFTGSATAAIGVSVFARYGIESNHPPADLNFILLTMATGVIVGMFGAIFGKAANTVLHRFAH